MCSPLQQALQSTTLISIADERLQSKWKVARGAHRRRLLTGWKHALHERSNRSPSANEDHGEM